MKPKIKITFGKLQRKKDDEILAIVPVFGDGQQIGELRKYNADGSGSVVCWNYNDKKAGESCWNTLDENLADMKRGIKKELEDFYELKERWAK